jgi:tRNA threonylcarbamoyladenosine biosynthesis protein TsaB
VSVPLILAIETATHQCTVALGRDGGLLAERSSGAAKQAHAASVNVFVDAVMREAGHALEELNAVAVGIGPGSYTGLRIGLSAAKGLCHALDIPIIGISTLSALARAAGTSASVQWPMIDARRMEVFAQRHLANGKPEGEVSAIILDEAWAKGQGVITIYGDGADKAVDLWKACANVEHLPGIAPHARYLLSMAEERLRAGLVDDLAYLVPAYGKEANVTQPGRRA